MTSHNVICAQEFVLFNYYNYVCILFGKTSKMLLSITKWVEETKDSLILIWSLRKDKSGTTRLWNEFHNKHCYLASISRLLEYIVVHKKQDIT